MNIWYLYYFHNLLIKSILPLTYFIVRSASVRRPSSSSAARDSPVSPAVLVKEPATVLSVKPLTPIDLEDSGMHDTSTAVMVTTRIASDSQCLSVDDEVDSSQSVINANNNINNSVQSISQRFVSSSDNQSLPETPKLHQAAR